MNVGVTIANMTKPVRPPSATTIDPNARALTWLRDHGSPRLVMSLMLASTIGCGFLVSVALHHIGISAPLWRYPLAVLAAWAVFLGLVSVWVWWQRRANAPVESARNSSLRTDWTGGIGPGNGGGGGGGGSGSGGGSSAWGGGGGRFGGAGASDSFAEAPAHGFASGVASGSMSGERSSGGKGGGWDLDFGGDDVGFVVLLIGIMVVAAAVFGIVFYAVYSAPTFFAELLIDGGVGTWIYKRADVANRPDWLTTAMQRSVWPVVVLLLMFIALALVMQHVAPGTTTLGQAWQAVSGGR